MGGTPTTITPPPGYTLEQPAQGAAPSGITPPPGYTLEQPQQVAQQTQPNATDNNIHHQR